MHIQYDRIWELSSEQSILNQNSLKLYLIKNSHACLDFSFEWHFTVMPKKNNGMVFKLWSIYTLQLHFVVLSIDLDYLF